ncbi:MAG: alpha/beta hydrolase [Candidatus Heimdallarchaeota archaeon]
MTKRDIKFLDSLDLIGILFHPRKNQGNVAQTEEKFSLAFEVDKNIRLGGRFYRTHLYETAPNLLFFHGNGEIATDYDNIAPMYQNLGINLSVIDFRGYGESTGTPTFSSLLTDVYEIFPQFSEFLGDNGFGGSVSVMGRSLGSGPALELANHFQKDLQCLILESGFANTYSLLRRLGISNIRSHSDKAEAISALPIIREIKIPLLVIHGERDLIVPLEEGIALYQNAGSKRKEILIIPSAGHNDLLYWGRDDYMAAISGIIRDKR